MYSAKVLTFGDGRAFSVKSADDGDLFRVSSALEHVLRQSHSQQVPDVHDDDANLAVGGLKVLPPPFNFGSLLRLPTINSTLLQCIEAMVTNVTGYGWGLQYIGDEEAQEGQEAQTERENLLQVLEVPNGEYSLTDLLSRVSRDRETLGIGYIEVVQDRDGTLLAMHHVPAQSVRMTVRDSEPQPVTRLLQRNGTFVPYTAMVHFRRYVQIVGTRRVYFREYGDPRYMDPRTGNVSAPARTRNEGATQLVALPKYSPGHTYGLPSWINQLPSVLGSRQAELTNLDFFKKNAIPAMAIMVSGGGLTQETIDTLRDTLGNSMGRDGMQRVVILEATGDPRAASDQSTLPPPKIELKPLAMDRQRDGNFLEYDARTHQRIRAAFRLPPLILGLSEDVTYAAAKASMDVAEAQVFGPERSMLDEVINRLLSVQGRPPQFWQFSLNPSRIVGSEEVVRAMAEMNNAGGMTPNAAIALMNAMLDLKLPRIEAPWGDYPIELVKQAMAQGRLLGVEDLAAPMPTPEPTAPVAPAGEPVAASAPAPRRRIRGGEVVA